MVRRRTRAAKSIVSVSEDGAVNVALLTQGLGGAAAAVIANGNVIEDQYFASPKRKDCKIDSGVGGESGDTLQLVREVEEQIFDESNKTRKSPSPGKSRPERGGISGRTIGVPLATRSQTRTIENYFKAKTAANKSSKNPNHSIQDKEQHQHQNSTEKTPKKNSIYYNTTNNNEDLAAFPLTIHSSNLELTNVLEHQRQQQQPLLQRQLSLDAASNKEQQQSDFIFDLSEDTTDTDNTELSDEYSTASGGGASSSAHQPIHSISNFDTHRSPMRSGGDSNSSRSSTTDNIFLQEPVLTLNVDKSPNQASSIKINKTLEIEPIFSSPPAITASALNGRFNKIVSLQCSPIKLRDSFGFEAQAAQATIVNASCYALSLENDNSSCDSGVAFVTTTLDTFSPQPAGIASSSSRRRKPATPHRIVCPSPIKAPPRIVSPACVGNIATAASGRKICGSKSQRQHGSNTGSKTRRRLNQPKDQPAPFESTLVQNGYKQNGHAEAEEHNHHIKNEPDEQEYENLPDDAEVTTVAAANNFCQNVQKSFLHTAVNYATTQQKQQNTLFKSHKTATAKVSSVKLHAATPQHPQPKIKLYQPPHTQPLAVTNGNRELGTFFQVRRSERKTKTAVKEEMMRNLEQAILEERAEGLKVAHFENKGRGIISERRFQRGEFVIEYIGDLISMTEAAEREKQYALDENAGCYMYYFKHKNQQYCIDATIDTGKLGRLVNHSRNGNLITKVVVVKQRPHLILIAKDDIEEGEELTYDYGDRSKESLLHHPWLAF